MSKATSHAVTPQSTHTKGSLGVTTPPQQNITTPSRAATAETGAVRGGGGAPDTATQQQQQHRPGTTGTDVLLDATSTCWEEPNNSPIALWQQAVDACVSFCFHLPPTGPPRRSVPETTPLRRLTVYAKYGPGYISPVPSTTLQHSKTAADAASQPKEVVLRGALKDRFLQPYELHQLLDEEERSFLCEVYCPGVAKGCEGYTASSMKKAALHANRTMSVSGLAPGQTMQGTIASSFALYNRSNKTVQNAATTLALSSRKDGNGEHSVTKQPTSSCLAATLKAGGSVGTALLGPASSRVAAVRAMIAPNSGATAISEELYGDLLKKKDPLFHMAASCTRDELIGLLEAASSDALDPLVILKTLRDVQLKEEASALLGGGRRPGSHDSSRSSGASHAVPTVLTFAHYAVLFQSVASPAAQKALARIFFDAISEKILFERQRRISILRGSNPSAAALRSDPRIVCRNTAYFYNLPIVKAKEISRYDSPTDILNALHRFATQISEVPTTLPPNPNASGANEGSSSNNAAEVMMNLKCLRSEFVPDRSKPGWDGTCCFKGRDGRLNPLLRARVSQNK